MPAKTPGKAKKPLPSPKHASKLEVEQRKERRLIRRMMEQERVMKWLLVAVVILLLVLFLLAGYATDWLRGINKDPVTVKPATSLDTTLPAAIGSATGTSGGGATSNTGSHSSDTSSGTSKDTNTTSTTTNNNSTTTTSPAAPNEDLLTRLYNDSSVGNDISSISNQASQLGVPKVCHTEILIQVCDFTVGTSTVTTKDLLGSGLITSVTKNF